MPIIPNAPFPTPPPKVPADVIDPVRYRFGGYVFERDSDDNIIYKAKSTHQPSIWSQRAVYSMPNLKLR